MGNMKAHSSQLISLNEIADSALLDLQESAHRREQFLHWTLKYYKRYRMDHVGNIKIVKLDMTPWKSIELPDDNVDWIAIGIPTGQMLLTFVNDPSLLPRYCACDDDEPTETTTVENVDVDGQGIQQWSISEFGENAGRMFGLIQKDNGLGYFNPHYNDRVNEIQLSARVKAGTKIVLIYLGELFDPSVDNVVHPYYEPMIRSGIHWENMKFHVRTGSRTISVAALRDAEQEFKDELCLAVERASHLTKEGILEAIRQSTSLSPKLD